MPSILEKWGCVSCGHLEKKEKKSVPVLKNARQIFQRICTSRRQSTQETLPGAKPPMHNALLKKKSSIQHVVPRAEVLPVLRTGPWTSDQSTQRTGMRSSPPRVTALAILKNSPIMRAVSWAKTPSTHRAAPLSEDFARLANTGK